MTKLKLTQEVKEKALEALRERGTMQYAAKVAGVAVRTLRNEMKRSEVFKRRVEEAREDGKQTISDKNLQFVQDVAEGKTEVKMPQLTANLAILNWALPGFRGTTNVQGKIEHNVRVITAVPRPKYDELEAPPIVKVLPVGRKRKPAVEDIIEGVAIESKEE